MEFGLVDVETDVAGTNTAPKDAGAWNEYRLLGPGKEVGCNTSTD